VAGSTLTLSADRGRVRPGWTSWQCGVCREYIFPKNRPHQPTIKFTGFLPILREKNGWLEEI